MLISEAMVMLAPYGVERIDRRLRIDQSSWRVADELVKALLARGQEDQAIETLRALWKRYPDAYGYGQRIARLLRSRGQYDRSLAEWRALEKLPADRWQTAAEMSAALVGD